MVVNKDKIKQEQTVTVIDEAIEELNLLKQKVIEQDVFVEGISIDNSLANSTDEVIGTFNLRIDADYIARPIEKKKEQAPRQNILG